MEASTQVPGRSALDSPREAEEAGRLRDPTEGAPKDVAEAADAEGDVSLETAHAATYWLLQPQRAPEGTCEVQFDTPEGRQTLLWDIRAVPGETIDAIELENTSETTGRLDVTQAAAELVAKATIEIRPATGASGPSIDINSELFRSGPTGMVPNAAEALKARFYFQSGILTFLQNEIRSLSGWSPDRVGPAKRKLVNLSGKPSGPAE